MELTTVLFYVLSLALILSALGVVLVASPIFSALFLALTMLVLSAIFFLLQAYFLAAIQLTVYAGAVVVLFVMVLMMFDLKKEQRVFSDRKRLNLAKIATTAIGLFLLIGPLGVYLKGVSPNWLSLEGAPTESLSTALFTRYIFTFEIIGALLLVVLIGSITLAKQKGGTHAKSD